MIPCFLILALLFSGCSMKVQPDKPDGHYATQNRLSSIEYSIYMNKQITVFVNQLSTRITVIRTDGDIANSNEKEMAEHSLSILKSTKDEVEVTYPSEGQDENRETTLTQMETAIADLNGYIDALGKGQDVDSYDSAFRTDVEELTGLANLYNE